MLSEIENKRKEEEIIKWLNIHIQIPQKVVTPKDVCENCSITCECCGEEIECPYDYDINECPDLKEKVKTIEARDEHFFMQEIAGKHFFLSHNEAMALTHNVPLDFFNSYYKALNDINYEEVSDPFLLVMEIKNQPDLILIGKGKDHLTQYNKWHLDQILKLVSQPTFYYAFEKPFLIKEKDYIFLLSPRISWEDYEDFTLQDYLNRNNIYGKWIPYEDTLMTKRNLNSLGGK